MKQVPMVYFSDVLCVWAYLSQPRVDLVKRTYGDQVFFESRFCSVFGDTANKIPGAWNAKGGYAGFNAHLHHAAKAFPEIALHPDLWLTVRPGTSNSAHLFLKAIGLIEARAGCALGTTDAATWALRQGFFEQGKDIAHWDIQCEIGGQVGVNVAEVEGLIHDGSAFAALAADYSDAMALGIQGSPTFVLNEGRQKLFGNVGFRILDANIQELLREPLQGQASWC
ncbi:MAG: DsbA family protein [Hyphomonadaceae bacterium]